MMFQDQKKPAAAEYDPFYDRSESDIQIIDTRYLGDKKVDRASTTISPGKNPVMPREDDSISDMYSMTIANGEISSRKNIVQEEEAKENDELDERAKELLELALTFKPSQYSDDHRCPDASSSGGFQITEPELQTKLKSAMKEVFVMAGKKILNGQFDLTKMSFPIKCMCPKTILQTISYQSATMPVYLNYAASLTDPLERFKLVMV